MDEGWHFGLKFSKKVDKFEFSAFHNQELWNSFCRQSLKLLGGSKILLNFVKKSMKLQEKYQHALMFYYSTLSMQSSFEPAKERIRTIYCFTEKSVRV